MPLLGPEDPLPARPQRIVVAGVSGSGKTTTARRIGAALQIEHVEIDALFHGPRWTERASFLADVRRFVAQPAWVTEWQYPAARPLLADRADLMVWLDLSTPLVMWRVTHRTLRRRVRRERLWNGNLEPPLHTFFTDPEHIVRWTWVHRRDAGRQVTQLVAARPELPVVQIRRTHDVDSWLRRVSSSDPAGSSWRDSS